MPPKKGKAPAVATPASLLRDATAALETGERRQRSGEDAKAIGYFQTVCSTLAGMRADPQGCLLWATAMSNLVELQAPSWSESTAEKPNLQLAASALEQGHAAAVAAGAPSDERATLLASRAECAGLLSESANDWKEALPWAAESAKLWEESLAQELASQSGSQYTPEASIETLCSLGVASMAFGKLALTRGTEAIDVKTRRAAQAAVKRGLEVLEEACSLCDSTRGDDLPDVLQQMAQTLWDASEVVPTQKRAEVLRRAADRAASSVRLQAVPTPESTCLLGDVLVALGEQVWQAAPSAGAVEAAAAGEVQGAGDTSVTACEALWHCRRALHEGYGKAMSVRSRDLSILCGMADALLDCGRLQRAMLSRGVDLALAQPETMAAPASPEPPPPPTAGPVQGEVEVVADDDLADLTDAVDQMQVDTTPVVMEMPAALPSPPPLPPATECLEQAARLYAQVLDGRPEAEWAAARVTRLDTMYNAACACALLGSAREEDCAKLLGALAAAGALRRADVEADADLAPLMPTPFMQSLLSGLP